MDLIIPEILADADAAHMALTFKGLSDLTRLKILSVLLHGESGSPTSRSASNPAKAPYHISCAFCATWALSPAGVKVSKFSTVLMTNTLRTCSKKLLRTAATSQNEGRPPDEKLYHSPARPGLR